MTPATICRFEAILETKISFFSRAISFLAAVSVNAIQRNNIDGTEPTGGQHGQTGQALSGLHPNP